MTLSQRVVVYCGVILITVSGLFPHWIFIANLKNQQFERSAGYALIFKPPSLVDFYSKLSDNEKDRKLDLAISTARYKQANRLSSRFKEFRKKYPEYDDLTQPQILQNILKKLRDPSIDKKKLKALRVLLNNFFVEDLLPSKGFIFKDEIAQHLSQMNNFDYQGAIGGGYSPDEIIEFLSKKDDHMVVILLDKNLNLTFPIETTDEEIKVAIKINHYSGLSVEEEYDRFWLGIKHDTKVSLDIVRLSVLWIVITIVMFWMVFSFKK